MLENFVGDFTTKLTPSIQCVKEGLLSEMFLKFEIIVTAKIGEVELNEFKFNKTHKLSAEEVAKILLDDNNLELGVFFDRVES